MKIVFSIYSIYYSIYKHLLIIMNGRIPFFLDDFKKFLRFLTS